MNIVTLPTIDTLNNIEIRIGHERITTFGQPLNDRNRQCSYVITLKSTGGNFTINCTEPLEGRYLTLQHMESIGSLEYLSITPLPKPSKYNVQLKNDLHLKHD